MNLKLAQFAVALSLLFTACKNNQNPISSSQSDSSIATDEKLLQIALKRKDLPTALVSINRILLADSSRTTLKDTLFGLYEEMQNAYAVADLGMELLAKEPDDLYYLEATTQGLELIGNLPEAEKLYNKMFALTGDLRLKLALARNQFNQEKVQEAEQNIQYVIGKRNIADTIKLEQPMLSEKNRTQMVKLSALAYQMLADLHYQTGNKKAAIANLEKALEVDQYFDGAAVMLLEIQRNRR